MILRLLIGRTGRPDVRLERCKMLAGGVQLLAIGVFAAAIVAPSFNPDLHPTTTTVGAGGLLAALIELLALRIMGYISPPETGDRSEDE